ncbi:MAG: M48 family metalloprotease [Phycisphaerales bacterium]|nr:M48 family metalloprotease [Phycisphaerales bacterium]
MIHALLIALVVITLGSETESLPFFPLMSDLPAGEVVIGTLMPFLVIVVVAQVLMGLAGRRLDRTGSGRAVRIAERVLVLSRFATVAWHGVAVLVLGWGETIRQLVPAQVLLDEVIIMAPPLVTLVMGWVAYFPIERRLRDAALIGRIDRGEPVHPTPGRATYVMDQVRHQLGVVLAPVALIVAWQELAGWGAERWWGTEMPAAADVILTLVSFAGVVLIIGVMPFVLRHLWDTVALGAGELRDRLMALCREQGVGCREVLLWRTHGLMLNGAVIGLIGRLRYILLTDALLERLTDEQVEAVMAHEVGHARFHHLPWLMLAMVESLLLTATAAWFLLDLPLRWLKVWPDSMSAREIDGVLSVLTLPPALVVALFVFGWISRRFERQADAFAVQHLSGRTREARGRRDLQLSEDAVVAMSSALGAVGHFNHIPLDRFTWRHGSLRGRQRRLHELAGVAAHQVPVDRLVRRIKIALTLGAVALGLLMLDAFLHGGGSAT